MTNIKLRFIIYLLFFVTALTCFFTGVANTESVFAIEKTNREIADNQRILPIYMYHQVLKNGKSDYIVTPDLFERDLAELKNRGYTSVLPSDVIAFSEGRADLPKKPVLITFDDGHYNNVYYCEEILQRYNFKAVINIIGQFSDYSTTSGDHSNPAYSHLTWEQIKETAQKGVFEFGNHTFNMHNYKPRHGIKQRDGETSAAYSKAVKADIAKLQDYFIKKSGICPSTFAYPFGLYNDLSEKTLVESGFKMIYTCCHQQNLITKGRPNQLYRLCRFNRSPKLSSKDFLDKVEKSKIVCYNDKID